MLTNNLYHSKTFLNQVTLLFLNWLLTYYQSKKKISFLEKINDKKYKTKFNIEIKLDSFFILKFGAC